MNKIKVMTIFGTRPEAIKMAPIVLEMIKDKGTFEPITVVTAQHREMLDQVLEIFKITPDYDLNIMKAGQSLSGITTEVIKKLDKIIENENPDIILVHGDTTTTFAASVSAFYHKIKIGHVEAGLRTWDKYSPYPEEMNRQLTDIVSDFYFAPTILSRSNLIKENHPSNKIFITGNTAIDALQKTVNDNFVNSSLNKIEKHKKIILLTMHRRENQGNPMKETFTAIRDVLKNHPSYELVYPVHLSPIVQKAAHDIFETCKNVHLIEPLDVVSFHNLISKSEFIMTDSGGIQEEAPSLNKPVLVLRNETERPEGVKAGTLKLIGTDYQNVYNEMTKLIVDKEEYKKMALAENPYGDGHASERILDAIKENI